MNNEKNTTTEEIVLEDNQIICALTDVVKPAKSKELTLQSLIAMLNEEYGFEMSDMERDFSFSYTDFEGKTKRTKIDLAVFEAGKPHDADGLVRICIVQDDKTKAKDKNKGVQYTLQAILDGSDNCNFGLWTNGNEIHFLQKEIDVFGQVNCIAISDFPGNGQTMEDLEKWSDKITPRKPANDSLVRTFKRCHDYIYGMRVK